MKRTIGLSAAAIIIMVFLLLGINEIINTKVETIKDATYTQTADNLKNTVTSHIEDKRNGAFAIALGLSDNKEIVEFLKTGKKPKDLRAFTRLLRQHANFPTVWIQLLDNRGISRYRTWTDKTGDSLVDKRLDVREMIADPHIMNTVSVGIFSMTFKSLVPVYDTDSKFLGSLEVIAHFDSIGQHLREYGMELVILVDKHYRNQITKPLTKTFIDDYYLVNADADPALLDFIKKQGVDTLLAIRNYRLLDDKLVTIHMIRDAVNEPMGYFLLFKPVESIDITNLISFQHAVKLAVPMGIFLLITAFFLALSIRRAKEARRTNQQLEKMVKERTRELENLNQNLEIRVAEEMEKQRVQEQHLIQQEKLASMSSMLTNISHHWRQPLNVLALNVQDIAEANEFGELNEAYIKNNVARSMEQIQYMSTTIENFMHFFNGSEQIKEFSILDTFKEVSTLLYPELKDSHISFFLPNRDVKVTANHGELKQVLLNIVHNAIEAISKTKEENGRINIELDEDDTYALISVSDNGGGIDEAIMNNIFEPYFTTKFKSKGVGISLYMSKIIVENNMNGTLTADNIHGGVKFTIRLPKNS